MRRAFVILLAVVMTIIVVAFGAISLASKTEQVGHNEHASHLKPKAGRQQKAARVDGSVEPRAIPDIDAYEILFRALTTTLPDDKYDAQRKASYLRMLGFSSAEASALTNIAYEYKRRVEPLDIQANDIKNHNWPNPSAAIKGQLVQLQRQKEAIVANSLIAPLKAQLINYDSTGKFDKMIVNEIKHKTKGFDSVLPGTKVGRVGEWSSNLFSVSAQAYGCDTSVYVYSSTWADYQDGMVYCNNSYSAPYDNCGHQYSLSFTLDSQTNPWIDFVARNQYGYVQTLVDVGGYCSQAAQLGLDPNFYAGGNTSDATIEAWVELDSFGPHGSVINSAHTSVDTTVSYRATSNASGMNFKINPGAANVSGITLSDITTSPSGETTITVSGTTFLITYSAPNTIVHGSFKPFVVATDGTVRVIGSPKSATSSTTITVN